MIKLTKEQKNVHDDVIDWVKKFYSTGVKRNWITVAGLAGTGKTTLIKFITDTIKDENLASLNRIAYVTYTGKASVVLRKKILELPNNDFIGTIHSLIYKPVINEEGIITSWTRKPYIEYDIIVVDEGSMVGKEIWGHLQKYGKPIIVVGDHGQLPPVGSESFSLLKQPDLILKQIHRQALENPIIKLSLIARKEGFIETRHYGNTAAKIDWISPAVKKSFKNININDDIQILCGMNKTRVMINTMFRKIKGFDREEPIVNEKVICLMNNKEQYIMNGQIGFINDIKLFGKYLYDIKVTMDGDNFSKYLYAYKGSFNREKYDTAVTDLLHEKIKKEQPRGEKINLFDFGYAISVHKSQGSEWDKVMLFEERNFYQTDENYARWLYTGITRAKNKLLIVKNFDGKL